MTNLVLLSRTRGRMFQKLDFSYCKFSLKIVEELLIEYLALSQVETIVVSYAELDPSNFLRGCILSTRLTTVELQGV